MSSEINSDNEMERRKALLEKHKEKEADIFKEVFISKSIETLADVTGITSALSNTVKKIFSNDKNSI